jgi:hypothetical protein
MYYMYVDDLMGWLERVLKRGVLGLDIPCMS